MYMHELKLHVRTDLCEIRIHSYILSYTRNYALCISVVNLCTHAYVRSYNVCMYVRTYILCMLIYIHVEYTIE